MWVLNVYQEDELINSYELEVESSELGEFFDEPDSLLGDEIALSPDQLDAISDWIDEDVDPDCEYTLSRKPSEDEDF